MMEMITKTIKTTGILNPQHKILKLDDTLSMTESAHVHVIILVTEEDNKQIPSKKSLSNSLESLTPDMPLAAAIYWYQQGKISQENAAEMAGLNRRDFLAALAREKCDVFMVDFEDLKEELARG
jgi:predicted HTH domain antitoxin